MSHFIPLGILNPKQANNCEFYDKGDHPLEKHPQKWPLSYMHVFG